MTRRLPWYALALLALTPLALTTAACDKDAADGSAKTDKAGAKASTEDPHAAFTDLAVSDVDKLISDKGCVAVDANGKSTREKYGVLPSAVLLSKTGGYDLAELPSDKSTKLVFYCGGQACSAAPKAAAVAQKAGYEDVNVMRAGIRGWVKAGKTVDKPAS